ncbi:unnamed protein product, partial [Porites evermanni]
EKSIAKAQAAVMLCNKEKTHWEYSGGSEGISTVHIYHHPVNDTYRIVGRLEKDQSVVINFALVKGLFYNRQEPTFHQWTDQSQLYGLNFVSKQDAQDFGNSVFTSLENLKTTGKAFKCCSNFLFIPHAVTSVSVKTCLNHKAENVLIK